MVVIIWWIVTWRRESESDSFKRCRHKPPALPDVVTLRTPAGEFGVGFAHGGDEIAVEFAVDFGEVASEGLDKSSLVVGDFAGALLHSPHQFGLFEHGVETGGDLFVLALGKLWQGSSDHGEDSLICPQAFRLSGALQSRRLISGRQAFSCPASARGMDLSPIHKPICLGRKGRL